MEKITPSHLERKAIVYVRQSTAQQVQQNLESQRRQYALETRASQLGWREITIIDDDLGCSASGNVRRIGFEQLIAQVCQGLVGAVLSLEASRLARNGHEWHRLLEFCALTNTLLIDHDGVYDATLPNDRLLLGMKGTVSEMELATLRQRSGEAIRQKARRGELYTIIPVGYRFLPDGSVRKDPDRRVQNAIELVFEKFREFGSARKTLLWFHRNNIELPRQLKLKGRPISFRIPPPSAIQAVLKNPFYAGAYAYGRTKKRAIIQNGKKRIVTQYRSHPDRWDILLKDHHESYISWREFEQNIKTLANNNLWKANMAQGAAQDGKALLAGILRCGHCGSKLSVSYHGKSGGYVSYRCRGKDGSFRKSCVSFGGKLTENAVVDAILDTISPLGIEAAFKALELAQDRDGEIQRQRNLHLEQARYQARLCQRQYDEVDPENRLVATTLEKRWNQALEKVEQLEKELQRTPTEEYALSAEEKHRLFQLAQDLPAVWHHPAASYQLKKRIVRTVIKEIVAAVEENTVTLLLHWQGGEHTQVQVRKNRIGEHCWKTSEEVLTLIKALARQMPDKAIAPVLNRLGKHTAKGHTWTAQKVATFRNHNKIPKYTPGEQETRGEVTVAKAASLLQVSEMTVLRMIKNNIIVAQQPYRGAPWVINAQQLQTSTVKNASPRSRCAPQSDQAQLSLSMFTTT